MKAHKIKDLINLMLRNGKRLTCAKEAKTRWLPDPSPVWQMPPSAVGAVPSLSHATPRGETYLPPSPS